MRRFPASAWLIVRHGVGSFLEAAGTRDAAQLAFFLLMSFPATLLLLVWSFSTVLGDDSVREPIVDAIIAALPLAGDAERAQVERLLDDVAAGAGTLGWIGIVALLYSASGAINGLRHALNQAWGVPEDRPFMAGTGLDIGVTLVAAPVVIVALGLILSGSLAASIGDEPWIVAVAQFGVTRLLPVALVLGLLAGLYRVLPADRVTMRATWLGALVGLAGIVTVQLGAKAWVSAFGDSGAVYGTMGALLIITFSVYLGAIAIVLGAHVSAQVPLLPTLRAREDALTGDETPAPAGRRLIDALRGLFVRSGR